MGGGYFTGIGTRTTVAISSKSLGINRMRVKLVSHGPGQLRANCSDGAENAVPRVHADCDLQVVDLQHTPGWVGG
jgi:hypothetical protein